MTGHETIILSVNFCWMKMYNKLSVVFMKVTMQEDFLVVAPYSPTNKDRPMKPYSSLLLMFFLSVGSVAATHSAWSAPIPWDAVTASVQMPGVKTPLSRSIEFVFEHLNQTRFSPVSLSISDQAVRNARSISITIFNLSGKALRHIDRAYPATLNVIRIDSRDDRDTPLAPGAYLLALKIGSVSLEKTFVIFTAGGAQ
jgi:hypothetical protein